MNSKRAGDDYSAQAYVRFVTASVDQLSVQRVVLAGNLLGGQMAWTTSVALPQRVARLVPVDASGYPPKSAGEPLLAVGQFNLHFQHIKVVLALQVDLDVVGIDLDVFGDYCDQIAL